jgi:hypothetical protein
VPADFGVAFAVRKMIDDGSEVYHVHLDPRTLQASCSCIGGIYNRHRKHAEAIVALIRGGKTALPESKPAPVASASNKIEVPESKPKEKHEYYCEAIGVNYDPNSRRLARVGGRCNSRR